MLPSRVRPTDGIRPQRLKFIDEYFVDFNATQAAIRAGYSPYCADVLGSQLLSSPKVAAEVARRKEEYKKKYEIRREFIVEKLFKLIQEAESDSDRATLIKSLDMLNKMAGNYTSTVVNINMEQPLFPLEPTDITDIQQ